jgi:hypothetical protein
VRVRAAVGGFDVSGVVLVESATVKQDSTEAISTAEVTVFQRYGTARYDVAEYDRAAFNEFAVNEWDELVLWDQDTTQLLFAGFILSVQRAIEGPHLRLTLAAADWGILFERALITQSWPDGTPDSTIIADALAQVPALSAGTIVTQVTQLGLIEAKDQRIRDLLDDICKLTGGEWSVSYDGKLNYYAAGSIVAPFGLSDHPNGTTLQPYVLEDYGRDFADAANRVVVLGAVGEAGELRATANDAASQAQFGVLSVSLVDRNLADPTTAALWAEAEVAVRANPKITIQATVYAAGLARGMTVPVEAQRYGIASTLILRSLEIGIIAPDRERPATAGHRLRYRAVLGSRPPDLVYSLRRMQRKPVEATQAPASSIAPGTIGPDDFMDSIEPVIVVNRKPAGAEWAQYSATAVFLLTTDRKLYRRTGDDWTAVVPTSDIVGQLQTSQFAPGSVTTTVLADGSVVTAKIPSGAITAPNIAVGAVTVSAIADGAVTTAKIPAGAIQAPQIAASAVTANAIAANAIAADKIQAGAVTANALAANSVTAGAIAANAITAGAISAGAVTATALAAGSVTANAIAANAVYAEAIQANAVTAQKLAANSVVAGKIAALAVVAGNLAADAVTAGTIAAGAVVAGKIGANAVTAGTIAAGAITADAIQAGSITSDKLSAIELAVGYGGNKPGRIGVYNSGFSLVGLVGDLGGAGLPGNTYFGVWAKLCAFGGTGYSDAPMYTDAAGNLSLRQVALKITASDGSFIQTGPSVFDATYGSIMLNVVKSGDSAASLVSRGLVVRTSGGAAVAGALVRSPTNGLTSELVINNPAGALTIWGDGNTGNMRAVSFSAGGAAGKSQTYFGIDGLNITFTGGLCTNITGPDRTGFWTSATLLKSGGGSVTLTFQNGLLVNAV